MNSEPWKAIFNKYNIRNHNFSTPYKITAEQIKKATSHFKTTNEREVRVLCKQDHRESRPDIFIELGLFILPIKNGEYIIVKGEGYIDIPKIVSSTIKYTSKLNFSLDTSKVGNSEMQHLDFAYATNLIRTFLDDDSLVLTIRGRKYTPNFSFFVNKQKIEVQSVQTEVDAGYEGNNKVVLIEAKNSRTNNIIIRQLFYPYKQWKSYTNKNIITLFFKKQGNEFSLWQFSFKDDNDYNSIYMVQSEKFIIE
jgi:hypothetical protein